MALIPVNRETLAGKRVKPLTSFAHLSKVPMCEITAPEFGAAAQNFPILFIERDGAFSPVVLFTPAPGDNLFVDEAGRWAGGYLPAVFRMHPFVMQQDDKGQPLMFIEEASGLLSDSEGEPLFGTDPQSDEAAPVGRALKLFTQIVVQGQATRAIMDKIAATGILQPLMNAPQPAGQPTPSGMHLIDEAKFNALSDETIIELRKAGALAPIYAHLFSLAQIPRLRARFDALQASAR